MAAGNFSENNKEEMTKLTDETEKEPPVLSTEKVQAERNEILQISAYFYSEVYSSILQDKHPSQITPAQTHQKSHQLCHHKHKENERKKPKTKQKETNKQQQQQQQNTTNNKNKTKQNKTKTKQQQQQKTIDNLTSDVMILGGDNSVKQMATIFDHMLETKAKKNERQ